MGHISSAVSATAGLLVLTCIIATVAFGEKVREPAAMIAVVSIVVTLFAAILAIGFASLGFEFYNSLARAVRYLKLSPQEIAVLNHEELQRRAEKNLKEAGVRLATVKFLVLFSLLFPSI
jgi:uncharacterized membrane protein